MYALSFVAPLVLLLASSVRASIYVTQPVQSTTCTGGQSCLVQWTDNGQAPLLAAIGECQVGLYTGEFVLAQSLQSVDVSSTTSFSFTPDPAAGPNGQYYLVFTSNSINYRGFSASFTLTGLTGTTPGGGSSTPTSTPTTSSSGSSTPSGSSLSVNPTGTLAPSGTSTPVAGTTTPTGSAPTGATTPTGTPTLTTPTATTTGPSTLTTPTTTSARTSTSASATPTSAASRVGSSMSLGGLAAMFVLSCVLAF